ncbi:MAG: cytochrome c biogenesis protein CcdA [Candidatus Lambdaproteobacteria bacterium]|nr:cytochrome c biogenesis protein CcdA [Candidatus Lambdaproteobacteria bacterium]
MSLQVAAANALDALAAYLPVGYAFGAGMVSTVNPCGFAMLPAYLALYLGTGSADFYRRPAPVRGVRALWISAAMTAGFVLLFGVVGSVVAVGGRLVISAMPWMGLLIGVALLLFGLWMLTGRSLSAGVFHRLAERIGDPRNVSGRGFFLYGIAFGAASLSCTLPIFLTVVGSAITAEGMASGLAQFIGYALGMGAVVLALTLSAALVKEGLLVRRMRRVLPYVQPLSASLLVLAGGFIVYYWLVIGRVIDVLG